MEGAQGTHKASKLASEDVFSSMPENVITNIMNRLPIRDALRTSILARNWRFKWTLLTELEFDCGNPESLPTLGPKGKKYECCRMISRLLFLLKGPVTKFALGIDDKIFDAGDVNHWVLFLSTKDVKEFTFTYYNGIGQLFKLHTHVFSCLELTHVNLFNCSFNPPPTFRGFPNLLSLQLYYVNFERGSFGKFITGCPLLQILDICFIYPRVKFNLDDIAKLENLKKFTLALRGLENRVITTSSIFQSLGFLPKLEELYLNFYSCELVVEDVARKWVPTAFPCLSTLALDSIDIGSCNTLSSAFQMIWGSPNLKELIIDMSLSTGADKFDVPPTELFPSDLGSNTLGQLQLQSVEIKGFRGSKNEVCLMKYLLACSPLLKRIAIHSISYHYIASDENLRAATDLLKLHRASPVAQVDFY